METITTYAMRKLFPREVRCSDDPILEAMNHLHKQQIYYEANGPRSLAQKCSQLIRELNEFAIREYFGWLISGLF